MQAAGTAVCMLPQVVARQSAPVAARGAAPRASVPLRSAFAGCTAPFAAGRVATGACGVRRASPAAESYAVALAESAQGAGSLDAVHADAETFAAYCSANRSIVDVLSNPVLTEGKKKDLVAKLAKEGNFSPLFVNFLNLLVDKRRIALVDNILADFEEIYCGLTDTQVATVTSAVKLENEQQFAIAKKLQQMTGAKNIKLKPVVDPALLGGFIVQYGKDGSASVDLSVKGQMDQLAAQLTASKA